MLTVLAIDCSTTGCAAAVMAGDGTVLAVSAETPPFQQAERLLPTIDSAVNASGVGWTGLGLIAVTVGPGSFTGLRLGLAAARGLGLARGLPVVGIGTADVFAHQFAERNCPAGEILVVIESKRADLFVQRFGRDLQPLSPIETHLPEDIQPMIGDASVTGDGVNRLVALPHLWPPAIPDVLILARLGQRHYALGTGLPAQPLYLRPPDVTIKARQP